MASLAAEEKVLAHTHGHCGFAEAWLLCPTLGPRAAAIWKTASLCGRWKREMANQELEDMYHLCLLFTGQHKSYSHS